MATLRTEQPDESLVAQGNEYAVLLVIDDSAEYRYAAFCPALPGCMSDGRIRDEALAMIKDAIALYLSSFDLGEQPAPQPDAMAAMTREYAAAGFSVETVNVHVG